MSKKAAWLSQDPRSGEWGPYDPSDTAKLEKSWQSNKAPVSLDFGGATFVVDLKKMEQRNNNNGSRKVRRDEVVCGVPAASGSASDKVSNFFKALCPPGETVLPVNQFGNLFGPLKVDPQSWDAFILMYAMGCQGVWSIRLEEWESGCASHGIKDPTASNVNAVISRVKGTLKARDAFMDFYTFCYKFCRNSVTAHIIPTEDATGLIMLLLKEAPKKSFPPEKIMDYMNAKAKGISADLWKQIGNFCMDVAPDFSNYSEDACWPTVIDDFVEGSKKKK